MREPVDHILRPPLPWRSGQELTECGYDASKVKTITREEARQREKELGRQRCALFTCMTCSETARRWETWAEDPRKAIGLEVEWESPQWRGGADRGDLLRDELVAIAALIESHPEEFARLVSDIGARRDWVQRKKGG